MMRYSVVVLVSGIVFCGTLLCSGRAGTAQVPGAASAPATTSGGIGKVPPGKGSIGRAALQLRDFEHDGMRLDLGEIEFNNVTYRTGDEKTPGNQTEQAEKQAMKVTGAGLSKVHLIVGAASLQKVMQGRVKDVSNLRLSLQNDRVKITGTRPAPFLGVPLPFSLDAKLEARQGDQLWLSDARLTLGGAPVPEGMAKSVIGSMNPVYVVNFTQQWGFRTAIKTITTRNDKLDITGNLVFMTAATPGAPATNAGTAPASAPAARTNKSAP